jgi:hypothetical protein
MKQSTAPSGPRRPSTWTVCGIPSRTCSSQQILSYPRMRARLVHRPLALLRCTTSPEARAVRRRRSSATKVRAHRYYYPCISPCVQHRGHPKTNGSDNWKNRASRRRIICCLPSHLPCNANRPTNHPRQRRPSARRSRHLQSTGSLHVWMYVGVLAHTGPDWAHRPSNRRLLS